MSYVRPLTKIEVDIEALEGHCYSRRPAIDLRHLVAQNRRPPALATRVHLLTKPVLCYAKIDEAGSWLFHYDNMTFWISADTNKDDLE